MTTGMERMLGMMGFDPEVVKKNMLEFGGLLTSINDRLGVILANQAVIAAKMGVEINATVQQSTDRDNPNGGRTGSGNEPGPADNGNRGLPSQPGRTVVSTADSAGGGGR